MKKWQEARNYRRIRDKHGVVIANIITVDGVDVEVTEEVYLAYSRAERRERYLSEDIEKDKVLSLEQMRTDNVSPGCIGMRCEPSAEDVWLNEFRRSNFNCTLSMALRSLSKSEQDLVSALFFHSISAREYARMRGVSDMAIRKRRDRVIKKLQKYFIK